MLVLVTLTAATTSTLRKPTVPDVAGYRSRDIPIPSSCTHFTPCAAACGSTEVGTYSCVLVLVDEILPHLIGSAIN